MYARKIQNATHVAVFGVMAIQASFLDQANALQEQGQFHHPTQKEQEKAAAEQIIWPVVFGVIVLLLFVAQAVFFFCLGIKVRDRHHQEEVMKRSKRENKPPLPLSGIPGGVAVHGREEQQKPGFEGEYSRLEHKLALLKKQKQKKHRERVRKYKYANGNFDNPLPLRENSNPINDKNMTLISGTNSNKTHPYVDLERGNEKDIDLSYYTEQQPRHKTKHSLLPSYRHHPHPAKPYHHYPPTPLGYTNVGHDMDSASETEDDSDEYYFNDKL